MRPDGWTSLTVLQLAAALRATWALRGQETNFLHQEENCKFPVLLRTSQVKQRLSESVRVLGDCFCLISHSRLLDEDALIVESGISLDMQIFVCGRLRLMESGSARSAKEEAIGLPSFFLCVVIFEKHILAGMGFPPDGCKGNFREQPTCGWKTDTANCGSSFNARPCVWACSMWCQESLARYGIEGQSGCGAPRVGGSGVFSELLEEVERRQPLVKLPEQKKERALDDLRDKLDKEKKHLERLESHAEKKRQEAEEAMQKHVIKQHEVDVLELKVEQARIKPWFPHRCPFRSMSHRCQHLSNLMLNVRSMKKEL